MKLIYENTELALLWLRKDSEDRSFAIDILTSSGSTSSTWLSHKAVIKSAVALALMHISPQYSVVGGENGTDSHKALQAISNLLWRLWFSRALDRSRSNGAKL
jgi:hypothetical protein